MKAYPNRRMIKRPLIMAHRGGRGLWPENTLFAFENAAKIGVDVLEADIHSTHEGIPVLIHDPTVDRTTDGKGPVNRYRLKDLKHLDAGYHFTTDGGKTFPYRGKGIRIPTLSEVFAVLPHMNMNIDIKSPEGIDNFCKIIRDGNMGHKLVVASFQHQSLVRFRIKCPEVRTSLSEFETKLFFGLHLFYAEIFFRSRAVALQIPESVKGFRILNSRLISAAHRRKLEVHLWTINEPRDMRRMMDIGVDGIVTDYPDRLLSLLSL